MMGAPGQIWRSEDLPPLEVVIEVDTTAFVRVLSDHLAMTRERRQRDQRRHWLLANDPSADRWWHRSPP